MEGSSSTCEDMDKLQVKQKNQNIRPGEAGGSPGGGGGGAAAAMNGALSPCGACKFLRRKCVRGCVFAPYFGGTGPGGDMNVNMLNEQQQGVGYSCGSSSPYYNCTNSSVGAEQSTTCSMNHRCNNDINNNMMMMGAGPPMQMSSDRFAAVHRVFGASNASKMLQRVPPSHRLDAVLTLCYEAQARLADPVYGCVSTILTLQQQVSSLQAELSLMQEHLANIARFAPMDMMLQSDHDYQPHHCSTMPPLVEASHVNANHGQQILSPSLTNMDVYDNEKEEALQSCFGGSSLEQLQALMQCSYNEDELGYQTLLQKSSIEL